MAGRAQGRAELEARWRRQAGEYVTAIDVSVDGRHCAVGTGAGAVLVIDTATGEVVWDRHAHRGGVLELRCSPAGRVVASCAEDDSARVFSLETGELLSELPGAGSRWTEHVSWTPDGQKLATSSGACVSVWNQAGVPMQPRILSSLGSEQSSAWWG
jgi:WD40 repeat protein